jgi:uncharacterized protein (TIGR02757 family)
MQNLSQHLNSMVQKYETMNYFKDDPISVVKNFTKKEDIEIVGFLVATISWGLRKSIIKNAEFLIKEMDYSPHNFILNYDNKSRLSKALQQFSHRTFNAIDLHYFFVSLNHIYLKHAGLENCFLNPQKNVEQGLIQFRNIFFEKKYPLRTQKHVSNILKNASAKRLNMYLRWMVRKNSEVDFGIWNCIEAKDLLLPLDVHTSRVSRKLNLLKGSQNNWKAVLEVTENLKKLDPNDPIKYDFALFGMGVEKVL